MRLICPNCDAQYEVPDEVVPTVGRDVQCSNCGKTWFQHHPDYPPEEGEVASADLSATEPAEDDEVSPTQTTESVDTRRRQLDPAVADILRQEAEVEFEARRRRQSQVLESQPDLGLEEGTTERAASAAGRTEADRAAQTKEHLAKVRGKSEVMADAVATATAGASRRELLPDIDEINSTLRNEASPRQVDAETRDKIGTATPQKRKSGFRRGFWTVLVLFAAAVLIYAFAQQIATAVPALADTLAAYTAWVDQLRLSLDTQLKSMLGTLDAIANEGDG